MAGLTENFSGFICNFSLFGILNINENLRWMQAVTDWTAYCMVVYHLVDWPKEFLSGQKWPPLEAEKQMCHFPEPTTINKRLRIEELKNFLKIKNRFLLRSSTSWRPVMSKVLEANSWGRTKPLLMRKWLEVYESTVIHRVDFQLHE